MIKLLNKIRNIFLFLKVAGDTQKKIVISRELTCISINQQANALFLPFR